MYPLTRLRRNRKSEWLRDVIAETSISPSNLILPLFVVEGIRQKQEIPTLPGVFRLSIDEVLSVAKIAVEKGIRAIALFPSIDQSLKTTKAEEAYNKDNLVCRCIQTIKNAGVNIGIICDVALDSYTTHGHDGILASNGDVDNDVTVEALCRQTLILAEAGADIVAPSDMMDGRIKSIRIALDHDGFLGVNILSYAAKYNSCFYSPYRDALNNTKRALDKSTYQMDIRNQKEALREIKQDINEGADIIMVKPGMMFLDIIHAAAMNFNIPIFAFQVTGEYAMLKFASLSGAINWEKALIESLISFRRAGATSILTYAALDAADILIG